MIDLDELANDANNLKPLGPSAVRLLTVVSGESWELHEVARIVELDQALTARLLRIVNSASSGTRYPISSVQEAIMRMGIGAVVSLVVGTDASAELKLAVPGFDDGEGKLWRHSVAAALAVEAMQPVCRIKPTPAAFTAALLHDIGKLVLYRRIGEEDFDFLIRAQEEGGMSSVSAEEEILSVDHAELSGLIGQHWKLPEDVVQAIRYHHTPERSLGDPETARFVQLADWVAKSIGADLKQTPVRNDDHAAVRDALGVSLEQFERLSELVAERLNETVDAYEI